MIFVCRASFNWDWILIRTNISVKHLLRLHFFSAAFFKRFANKPDLRSRRSRAAFKPHLILSPRAHRDAEPFPQQAAASSLRLSKFGVLRRGTPALPRRKTHKHTSPTPKPLGSTEAHSPSQLAGNWSTNTPS